MQALVIPRPLLVLKLLAVLQFALFVAYFPFAIILTPYGDIFDWLTQYYNLADQSLWQFLWTPHNGHPIVFTKLLTIGDAELLGGLSYPAALVCISMWLMVTAFAIIGVRRSVKHSQTRSWVTAAMVLLLFPTSSFSNFAYPVNSAFVIVSFFVFIACVLLAHTAVLKAEQRSGIITFFVISLIVAGCASVSAMNGLIVWPILIWIAWSLDLGRNKLAAIGAMAVFFALLFGFSHSGPGEDISSIVTLGDIPQILRYLAEFHGMPWTEVGPLYWPSTILGAMIFFAGIVFSLRGILASRALAPHDVVATAMLIFGLSTAVMIAIGRYKMGLLPAHRYGIFLQIIYVSQLVINMPVFERWMNDGRKCAKLLLVSLVFALGYLGQQVAVGQFSVERAHAFAQHEKDILAGNAKPLALKAIYFYRVNRIEGFYRLLKEQKIYMFRPNETLNSLDKPEEMQRRDEAI